MTITHQSEHLPSPSAHQDYWEHRNSLVYEYDPTDDGPEVEAIIGIRINHPEQDTIRRNKKKLAELLSELVCLERIDELTQC
jgi:hypothetical protein